MKKLRAASMLVLAAWSLMPAVARGAQPVRVTVGPNVGEDLDGDVAIEGCIKRLVNNRHATSANLLEKAIVAKGAAL